MAKETSKKADSFEDKPVLPNKMVEVKWTGKDAFHAKDSKSFVHELQAAKLVDKGFAEEVSKSSKPGKAVVQTQDV